MRVQFQYLGNFKMRKEYNCVTGEVTEHEDAPVTPQTQAELDTQHNASIQAKMVEEEKRIVCAMCDKDPVYAALKAQLKEKK